MKICIIDMFLKYLIVVSFFKFYNNNLIKMFIISIVFELKHY